MAIAPAQEISEKKSVPAFSLRRRLRKGVGLALVAFVLTLIYYAPSFIAKQHNPQTGNLAALLTSYAPPLTNDAAFYQDWNTATASIKNRDLPLWVWDAAKVVSPTLDAPLLANSDAPLLYPLSLIYYFGPTGWNVFLFSAIHFWILTWSALLILSRLRSYHQSKNRQTFGWVGLILLAIMSVATVGLVRPDYLAALSWGVLAIRVLLGGRRIFQLLMLSVLLGLLILATTIMAVSFMGSAIVRIALLLEALAIGPKPRQRLLRLSGALTLVLTGAISLAGPQLWPRLVYLWGGQETRLDAHGVWHPNYVPLSFELGLYAAFLAIISVMVGLGVLGWLRFYVERDEAGEDRAVRRVAKNSLTPLLAQLLGKVVDVGYALFTLRLLGVYNNGAWATAQTTWLFMATFTEFGLETLITRDVARDRSQTNANYYLNTIFFTRSLLSLTALPIAVLLIGGLSLSGNLPASSAWAIVVLAIGLIPSGLAGSLSAIFRAYEKFEYTAALQIFTAIVKVPLGLALLLIWGVVGLAVGALLVNLITLWLLYIIFCRKLFVPHLLKFDPKLARGLLHEAYPFMLNGFLINLFFQSDTFLLLPFRGPDEVGWYNAAYKFINGLLIIPSTLTLALFPLFSSYGTTAKENLLRAYREALRILVAIALPISVGTLFVAYDIIGAVAGNKFLPNTAIALQILIWFLPFSYINGVTQYVLIALNRQRTITWAVIGSVITNMGLNLIFIPFFGYRAASVMTIVSEVALLIPFGFIIKNSLGNFPLLTVSIRPAIAALTMGLVLVGLNFGLHLQNFFVTVAVGGVVYIIALIITRSFTKDDVVLLKKALQR